MAGQIEGKVAKIIDEQTIVINVGAKDGVTPKMQFAVFTTGEEVADPDTGEVLGRWEMVKGHVQAAHVQERITVCTGVAEAGTMPPREADPTTHTLSSEMTKAHMTNPADVGADRQVKIPVNPAQIEGRPDAGPIGVGDKVRSVTA